jgi:curved DNA-binding protein CbpA
MGIRYLRITRQAAENVPFVCRPLHVQWVVPSFGSLLTKSFWGNVTASVDLLPEMAGYYAVSTKRRTREHPLLAKEALDVLALRSGATSVEIKEAYRDLVKVWHPDRFGSDPRLRQKAEDKLKLINRAYQVLESGLGTRGTYAGEPEGAASSTDGDASFRRRNSSSAPPIRGNGRARTDRISVGVGWLYGCVGIALGLMAGYVALEHRPLQGARASSASVQQVEASSQQIASTIPALPEEGLAGRGVSSAEVSRRNVRLKDSDGSNRPGSAQFRVRSLSSAETDQLESACSKLKELKDATAYRACVQAQLDVITNSPGQPDLSALSGEERESMESVCSAAKRVRGADGYDRCLTAQMAKLAAEPARPDLSELKETDRRSIEAACRKAKYRDGPAAYNRCRMGLIKLLAESK